MPQLRYGSGGGRALLLLLLLLLLDGWIGGNVGPRHVVEDNATYARQSTNDIEYKR